MTTNEKQAIRNMLKGYHRITKTMIKTLESYGLIVSCQGKHYKVCRRDNVGGVIILAKTPSDYRSGLNISRFIIRLIES